MARNRRKSAAAEEPVAWRDGVHVVGTPIWCDARRARDLCFVSAADRVGRAGHGQLIASAATLAQLGAAPGPHLPAPYRRPFTLGTLRLELMPSGHALGGAVLLVDAGERRVLCAGVVAPRGGGLGEPCEVRRADVFVVAAPYGAERHVFPPVEEVASAAVEDIVAVARAGGLAGVLVTSSQKGLDVAARLLAAGVEVAAHRSIHHAARRLAAAGVPAPLVRRARLAPGALLWPVRERARLPSVRRTLLVSGLATEPETVDALEVDAAYAWSNAADRAGLLEVIAATGATRVFLTGRCADDAAAAIGEPARVLAPPHQMELFG
jgi:putative mRNA 3-end processing factor